MASSYYSADLGNWAATDPFCITELPLKSQTHTKLSFLKSPEEQGHVTANIFRGCAKAILQIQVLNG